MFQEKKLTVMTERTETLWCCSKKKKSDTYYIERSRDVVQTEVQIDDLDTDVDQEKCLDEKRSYNTNV